MIELLVKAKAALDAGGAFIYPIHAILILSIAITIERVIFLYFKSSMNVRSFLNQLTPSIQRRDLQSATQYCDSVGAPAARLGKALIVKAIAKGTREDLEATIESSLVRESHPIEKRTGYLSMLANIATLLGLLGTISGLIQSFAAAAKTDPNQKAELLAFGISEAMNCTAYGLIVAIFALVAFAILQGKTQSLLDELKEVAFELRSLLPNQNS